MKRVIIVEIIIWTFILAVLFCGAIFVYSKIFIEPNIYTIKFKDINGITKGSPVRFMGINAGYVRKLRPKDKNIDVDVVITKKDIKIPNGTVARVEFYGLGGSKSIELMPPDGSCDVGILTSNTIRIADVVKEAVGLVEVLEQIDRYLKNIDSSAVQKVLNSAAVYKTYLFNNANEKIDDLYKIKKEKFQNVKVKQAELKEKIENIEKNVDKINKFINK